ncbi:hypothetical protein M9H77_31672 [Catharanthus roseus]|uniref:Uncharacterized protein n=1 Tax=Catharanthus roseus TaxID=4058 RepID=A0ACC0A2L6_CATRO|nr:hypothetical protein M9H77_31672 [Catharanthus roseus]
MILLKKAVVKQSLAVNHLIEDDCANDGPISVSNIIRKILAKTLLVMANMIKQCERVEWVCKLFNIKNHFTTEEEKVSRNVSWAFEH